MRENFTTKLIKRAYGISGPLDEYKKREVDRIGNIGFIYLVLFIVIASLIALLLANHRPQLVAYGLPISLILFGLGLLICITTQVTISEINLFDKEELTESDQKLYNRPSWKIGLIYCLVMYGGGVIADLFALKGTLLTRASHPKSIFFGLFCGLFFGLMTKFLARYKQEVDDDKS